MKLAALLCTLLSCGTIANADPCQDRFAELLVSGFEDKGPTLIHITQEIVGGQTSVTWHHSDGNGNGMSEVIEPDGSPWSLFLNGKMYTSADKGKNWTFMSAFDGAAARAKNKAAMIKDAATVRDLSCTQADLNGAVHEVVEGTYTSSVIAGAEIFEKTWVNPKTGAITQSYRHVMMDSYQTKTTQVIEPHPDLNLPNPE